MPADTEQEFDAILENDPARDGVFVVAPFRVADVYGTPDELPGRATLDGFPYRGELTPLDGEYHALVVPREVRRAVGKTVGDTLRVVLRPDPDERVVTLPDDLAAALAETPAALAFFKTLAQPDQRDYVRYLAGAKTPEVRSRRLTETVYRLGRGHKRAAK